jgi:glutamyl-tRNA(Gln) amidotransferase subunit D
MYSGKLGNLLKMKSIQVGDRIVVRKGTKGKRKEIAGLLMPQTGAGNPNTMIIKLDSGYNIGLRYEIGTTITKSRHKAPRKTKEQGEYEMGQPGKPTKLKFLKNKPSVSLISVGGTISSRIDYKTGGVTALSQPSDVLFNVPELKYIVNIKNMLVPFNKMSEDINYQDWQKIAEVVAKRLNSGDKGVIVTHGTDFLHYTAAALSFFLRDLTKPVVVVGSQRSTDRGSSDGGMNLVCASHAAISDIAEVGICMHSSINDKSCLFSRGTKVRKMDTQRRDAFRPINEYPLALIWPDGKITVKNRNHKKRNDKGKVRLDTKFDPRIAMLKVYPGSDPGMIDYLVGKGVRGFVIEVAGLGHVPTNGPGSWIPTITRHVNNGIPFFTAPQTIYGRINPNVYSNLRTLYNEAGAIPLEDMLPETAYIKLGWVLGHFIEYDDTGKMMDSKPDAEKVKKMMLTNYAGEITKRTLAGAFLY